MWPLFTLYNQNLEFCFPFFRCFNHGLNLDFDFHFSGVLTSSIPLVLKQENLLINEHRSMVTEIKEFSRQEKMQLEYVFLWYLTKIYHAKEPPYAYKGILAAS